MQPCETRKTCPLRAALVSRRILGSSFSAPGTYSLPSGIKKSSCASTSQKITSFETIRVLSIQSKIQSKKASRNSVLLLYSITWFITQQCPGVCDQREG